MQRRRAVMLLASGLIGSTQVCPADERVGAAGHVAWVGEVLTRMQTIKPGMTRKKLNTLFTTEGGLYSGLRRTYISRDCAYFKVDVVFQAVGRPNFDEDGRVTLIEGADDIILSISKPFLEFSVMD